MVTDVERVSQSLKTLQLLQQVLPTIITAILTQVTASMTQCPSTSRKRVKAHHQWFRGQKPPSHFSVALVRRSRRCLICGTTQRPNEETVTLYSGRIQRTQLVHKLRFLFQNCLTLNYLRDFDDKLKFSASSRLLTGLAHSYLQEQPTTQDWSSLVGRETNCTFTTKIWAQL